MPVQSSELGEAVYEVLVRAEERLRRHAASEHPRESVGIIGTKATLYPLINQKRSAHAFWVSSTLVAEGVQWLRNRNEQPLAFYHSHPTTSADPSDADTEMMERSGTIHVIVGIDRTTAWLWDDGPTLIAEVPRGERPAAA